MEVSIEQDLGRGYIARASYIGMNTYALTEQINLNEVMPSKNKYNKLNTPFPNWGPSCE